MQGHGTRLLVQAAGDGGELEVVEEESSGVTGAGSISSHTVRLRAGGVVAEAQSTAQSGGLAGHLLYYRISKKNPFFKNRKKIEAVTIVTRSISFIVKYLKLVNFYTIQPKKRLCFIDNLMVNFKHAHSDNREHCLNIS